jgi:hypothetical protein
LQDQHTVSDKFIGDPLDRLARQPHLPSDVRHGSRLWQTGHAAQHLPACRGKAERLGESVSGGQERSVQSECLEDELGHRRPGR